MVSLKWTLKPMQKAPLSCSTRKKSEEDPSMLNSLSLEKKELNPLNKNHLEEVDSEEEVEEEEEEDLEEEEEEDTEAEVVSEAEEEEEEEEAEEEPEEELKLPLKKTEPHLRPLCLLPICHSALMMLDSPKF
jgi:hypothetical protein